MFRSVSFPCLHWYWGLSHCGHACYRYIFRGLWNFLDSWISNVPQTITLCLVATELRRNELESSACTLRCSQGSAFRSNGFLSGCVGFQFPALQMSLSHAPVCPRSVQPLLEHPSSSICTVIIAALESTSPPAGRWWGRWEKSIFPQDCLWGKLLSWN